MRMHILSLAALVSLPAFSAPAITHPAPKSAPAAVEANYGKLPLNFEANQGQTGESVQFLAHGQGYSLFLTEAGPVLALGKGDKGIQDVVHMSLAGASPRAQSTGESELPGKVNYFLGNDPTKWHSDLPTYAKVRYTSIYAGIDLIYYGNQRQLEYDFIVAPGANPASIRLNFTGQKQLHLDPNGDLTLESETGATTLHKPVIYQENQGRHQPIVGNFLLQANNTLTFKIGSYDHTRPLVIDPILVYSTYLGGSGNNGNGDQGNGIAVDSTGHAYVVGTTFSTDFPVTAGGFQPQNSSTASTVFVTKLNPTGTALVYSTYLGGTSGDFGYGIALDSSNNAYITGSTYSDDFPITCGAFQTINTAAPYSQFTGFVTKLTPAGNTLAYSTYLGGTGYHGGNGTYLPPPRGDVSQAIAVDAYGNAFMTGYTYSADFPVTDGAFQGQFSAGGTGATNAFVTKLNPAGTALLYSTFLGGNGLPAGFEGPPSGDAGNSIAIDSAGDAFITGVTNSYNFPVTSGAFQGTPHTLPNAFVTKLNPTGTGEVYSTFLGGSGAFGDFADAIAVDPEGFAYVAGNTQSSDFPVTEGVQEGPTLASLYYDIYTGYTSAPIGFVTKLSRDGSSLEYSTYLEGLNTVVTGLAVDKTGNAYVTGNAGTASTGIFGGFVATPDALPTPSSTGNSAFLAKLNPTATAINYATLLGGNSNDGATAIALDHDSNVYLAGSTTSTDFPATSGAFMTKSAAAAGGSNAFIGKFALATESNLTTYPDIPPNPTGLQVSLDVLGGGTCGEEVDYSLQGNVYVYGDAGLIDYPGGFLTYTNGVTDFPGDYFFLSGFSGIGGDYAIFAVTYSGSVMYQPSSTVIGFTVPCFGGSDSSTGGEGKTKQRRSFAIPLKLRTNADHSLSQQALGRRQINMKGPKFSPTQQTASRIGDTAENRYVPPATASTACVSPLPPLTVALAPASTIRLYGAANPRFLYSLTGLLPGDKVTVALQTTAIATSPVGAYPIEVQITGPAAGKYHVVVTGGTLTVLPAPLAVTVLPAASSRRYGAPNPSFAYNLAGIRNGDAVAATLSTIATPASPVGNYQVTATATGTASGNYTLTVRAATLAVIPVQLLLSATSFTITYGQTPAQPTAFTLKGFVNGDTVSVVSGAPALSTPVTATTPVGYYLIQTNVGTLNAANYTITPFVQSGIVRVGKASLSARANNLTMPKGGPVPTLTYTITGFVNGDTPASSVTGAPTLKTSAGPTSKPGNYPIYLSTGTLGSANYSITPANGVLTILP